MSHTPGPWTLETVPINNNSGTCHRIGPFPNLGVYDTTHACVYADQVSPHDYGHSKIGDELLANARLISAAPELLEALKFVLENPMSERGVDTAKRAIAKAEGKA